MSNGPKSKEQTHVRSFVRTLLMDTLTTLRAASCDTLAAVSSALVAATGAKKTYFVSTSAEADNDTAIATQGSSTSAASSVVAAGISVPPRAPASCPFASAADEPLLLVASSVNPLQVELHDEASGCAVKALLSVDAPGPIHDLQVRHGVLVVRSEAGENSSAGMWAFAFYRVDPSRAREERCLRHLGTCLVSAFPAGSSPQWFVDVSSTKAGVQEGVIVGSSSGGSIVYIGVVDISGTIAAQRASTILPLSVVTANEDGGAAATSSWSMNWHRRELHVVLNNRSWWFVSINAVANRTASAWSNASQNLPASAVALYGLCTTVDGRMWLAAAPSSKASDISSLFPLALPTHASTTVVEGAAVPIGAGPVLCAVAHADTIFCLQGKRVTRYRCAPLLPPSEHASAQPSSSSTTTSTAEDLLKQLFASTSGPAVPGSSCKIANAWVQHLRDGKRATSSQRPTAVLRDSEFLVMNGTDRAQHLILDVLLTTGPKKNAKGASKKDDDDATATANKQDAVLRYFSECTSVEAASIIRAFVQLPSPALQLAVWVLIAQQHASDLAALDRFARHHVSHLRRERLEPAVAVELFVNTCAALEGALETNIPACVSLGAALADAIVVVHGKALVDVGGSLVAEKWSHLAATLSALSTWALEWAAPAMGQLTAHTGVALIATKEAQFIPSVARRIRTTKEADIHQTSFVLEAPSVTRANKRL